MKLRSARTHDDCDWCGHESRRHSRRFAATARWHIGFGVIVQYEGPVSYGASTMTVTGVDMILDKPSYELQQPKISYAAPFQHTSPAVTCRGPSVHVAPALVVKYMTSATAVSNASSAPAVNAAPAPDVEFFLPAPAVNYGCPPPTEFAAPTPVGEYISPAATMIYAASAPVVEHICQHKRNFTQRQR